MRPGVSTLATLCVLGLSCAVLGGETSPETPAGAATAPRAGEIPATAEPVPRASAAPRKPIPWEDRDRLRELFPPAVLAHAERLFPEQPDVPVGPAFRDLSPPEAYHEANRTVGAAATLDAAGGLVGHVAGRPFAPETIDCAGAPEAAGLRLAWNRALAWEGDGAAGTFRVRRDAAGEVVGEPFEGTWRKIWLSHRIEPELLAGQGGDLFRGERRRFAYVVDMQSGDRRGIRILHYRYAGGAARSGAPRQGDTWIYVPTLRRVQRISSAFHSAPTPHADLILEDFPDFPLAVQGHRFRCLGQGVLLVPFAPAAATPPVRSVPAFGGALAPLGPTPRPRFEARRTWALEARPRAEGAAYARRVLHLDAQTFRPVYVVDFDARGEPVRVHVHTHLWSGDDPERSPGWAGVPEPRALLPFRSVALDVPGDVRTRIDFWNVRSHPLPSKGKIRRLIDIGRNRCIAAGTPIATPSGPRPVEELRPGDPVWSYDRARKRVVEARVASVVTSTAELTLRFPGGLRVTEDHPLFASGAWIEAGKVAPEAELLRRDGSLVPAGRPERVEGRVEVFDLSIDGPHNFFAAERLVHNKAR